MKAFANVDATDPRQAAVVSHEARARGQAVAFVGGGSDLLAQMKLRVVEPDVLVNLKTIGGLDRVSRVDGGVRVGGLITLDALARDALIRRRYPALAEAAESVATPQIRNVATLAGNICQRPWCWYYRAGFPCFKNGGSRCYAVVGENQFHAIFGGGPSYIVHPSDTAPVLVATGARFRIVGPTGERTVAAEEFFTLPAQAPARENVLEPDEVLADVILPAASETMRGTYFKVLDREAWTHAVVSVAAVLDVEAGVCRNSRVVLGGVAPVPWRLPRIERLLEGQRLTPELAATAGLQAVVGATPLAKNRYKLAMTQAAVRRTLLRLAEGA